MKFIFLNICCYIFFYPLGYAQSTWFRIHDLGFAVEEPWAVCNLGKDFVIITSSSDNVPITRNEVIMINQFGEMKWRKLLFYPISAHADLGEYYSTKLVISKDSFIYSLSASQNWEGEQEFLINKFDKSGNLVWYKTYGIVGKYILPGSQGLTLAQDSLGIIMTGSDLGSGKLAVCQIDSSGEAIWHKVVGVPVAGNVGLFTPVVNLSDRSIKVAYDNNTINSYKDYLVSLDSNGNLEYTYANPLTGKTHDLQLHPNGNLVYLSNERNPPMFENGGLRIQMLTPDFDTVWSHLFYDTQFPYLFLESAFVRNLSISPDGKILALGYNVNNCILLCYAPDGTLLWKREVALEGFDQLKFNYVTWASDGGILLDGFIYGEDENNQYYQKTFFLKLDDVGCLQPGCQQTIITDAREIAQVQGDFDISPNPSQGEIEIRYKGTDLHLLENVQVSVHDANGKLVIQGKFAMNNPQLSLNLLAAGIYMISINDGNGVLSSSKLLQSGKILIVH